MSFIKTTLKMLAALALVKANNPYFIEDQEVQDPIGQIGEQSFMQPEMIQQGIA